ncbi:MAG: transcriptional regulator [Bacteroidaceae bacterium]|nr:transcriptional regulator [Bacteroidaceae bacterium]
MSFNYFYKHLQLLDLLVNHGPITVQEMVVKLGVDLRVVYRYLNAIKDSGIEVEKIGPKYIASTESPILQNLVKGFRFSQNEILTILKVFNSVNDNSPEVRYIKEKLSAVYNKKGLAEHGVDRRLADNLAVLYQAYVTQQIVCLKNYDSPSSGKVSDRYVEPYMFLSNNTEVRCYEVLTHMNKTFKVARAESVELLDLKWSKQCNHSFYHVDLFQFTGEKTMSVSLILGNLSKNVLLEEYPLAERYLKPEDDGRYRLDIEVCSYKGVGRFVIGLFEDIEILGNEDFILYIRECIQRMQEKLSLTPSGGGC